MEKEIKIYMIDCDCGKDDWNDAQFMTIAEEQGTVYSLAGFEKAFNNEEISDQKWLRII